MKKEIKIIVIILSVLVLIALGILGYIVIQGKKEINVNDDNDRFNDYENNTNDDEFENNMKEKMKAVILKVNKNNLLVMKTKDEKLMYVSFTEEGNIGYKENQEICIYYNGMILSTYPGQLYDAGKIEIVKEKTDIEIPEKVLRYCYSSYNNVKIDIEKLTCKGITLSITDTNELKYSVPNSYIISKQVKNENYTGQGYKTEATKTSTSAYIRTRT